MADKKLKYTIKNELEELRKMSNEKLIKEKKRLKIDFLSCNPKAANPRINPSNKGKLRQRIARINTILGERNLRGVAKEEVRLT